MLRCPYCTSEANRVVATRDFPAGIRRKRRCMECGKGWLTTETADTLTAPETAGLSTDKAPKTQRLASSAPVASIYDTRAHTAAILNVRRPLLRD